MAEDLCINNSCGELMSAVLGCTDDAYEPFWVKQTLLSCFIVDEGSQTDSGNQAKLALVQLSSFLYSLLDVSAVKTKCGGLGEISFHQSLPCNV